jgi:hypothetical protein
VTCSRCRGTGWICEEHPWIQFPHDACAGPGEPCPECQPPDGKPRLLADWQSITSVESALVWTLRQGARMLTCRVRDDSRSGAGYDVQILDDGVLIFSQRCPLESGARYLAGSLKGDHVRMCSCVIRIEYKRTQTMRQPSMAGYVSDSLVTDHRKQVIQRAHHTTVDSRRRADTTCLLLFDTLACGPKATGLDASSTP